MAHEDHTPRCSNSSGGGGGGRLSKKLKHKKVPQRGMGVAQLEKIILEEQNKNDVAILTPNSTNFMPSIPLPPPLPPNYHPLIPKPDATNPSFVSKPTHRSRSWSGVDHRFEGENPNPNQNRRLDHRAYAAGNIPTDLSGLQYGSDLSFRRPLPTTSIQRSQLFQQPCSSSMGNPSLGTTSSSSLSSSVMNFQMEPPSIQSYHGKNYPPPWPEEDKVYEQMVGMKRSYPFSIGHFPIPSFNCKFPFSQIPRSNESTSCTNGVSANSDPPNPAFRENPHDQTTKKLMDENGGLGKDFLTLAPPRALSQSPPHQGQTSERFHSFFPAAKTHGEEGEHVDLNLKL